jgi:hypothetical protein
VAEAEAERERVMISDQRDRDRKGSILYGWHDERTMCALRLFLMSDEPEKRRA